MSESVHKAFELLRVIGRSGMPMNLAEIAAETGQNKATLLRYLKSLTEVGALEKRDGAYTLGLGLSELAAQVPVRDAVIMRLMPTLEKLRDIAHESSSLALLQDGRILYAAVLPATHSLRISARAGDSLPLHCSASGRAILAALPESEAAALLAGSEFSELTPHTITNPSVVGRMVEEARRTGIAHDKEEVETGLVCIATALRIEVLHTAVALSVSGPANRLGEERLLELSEALLDVRQEAAALLEGGGLGLAREMTGGRV